MNTLVIDLHGRRDDPNADPALNPNVNYISRRQWWGPGRVLDAHPLQNPFTVKRLGSHEAAVSRYCRHLLDRPDLLALVPALRGHTLGCWCPPLLCHGHVLAVLADAPQDQARQVLVRFVDDPGAAVAVYAACSIGV